jgi:hypothetical protein
VFCDDLPALGFLELAALVAYSLSFALGGVIVVDILYPGWTGDLREQPSSHVHARLILFGRPIPYNHFGKVDELEVWAKFPAA